MSVPLVSKRRHAACVAVVAIISLWWVTARSGSGDPVRVLGAWDIRQFIINAAVTHVLVVGALALVARRPLYVVSRASLITASVVTTLTLLELPAYWGRVDYSTSIGIPEHLRLTRLKPWENPSNVRDDELLWRRKPGLHYRGNTVGDLVRLYGIATDRQYQVEVRYDALGFRNEKTHSQADLVLIGDSFAEAALVTNSSSLAPVVAQQTGRRTVNFGVSGYGPQQELVVLRRYALPLQPEIVVWLFFEGNDLRDAKRYEQLDGYGVFGRSDWLSRWGKDVGNGSTFRTRSLVWNAVSLFGLATHRTSTQDSDRAIARSCTVATPDAVEGKRIYFAYGMDPLEGIDPRAIKIVRQSLRSADSLVSDSGARMLLAFVPTKYRVYHSLCRSAGDVVAGWSPHELPAVLGEVAASLNQAFLDLTPGLTAAASRGELVYFQDDGHWNSAGIRVAAGEIARQIRALHW